MPIKHTARNTTEPIKIISGETINETAKDMASAANSATKRAKFLALLIGILLHGDHAPRIKRLGRKLPLALLHNTRFLGIPRTIQPKGITWDVLESDSNAPDLEASEEHQPAELSTPFSILKDLRHPRITASRILATKSDLSRQYELLPFTYYYQIIPEPQISAGEQCPSPNIKASVTPKLRPLMKRTCPYSIKPSAPDNPFVKITTPQTPQNSTPQHPAFIAPYKFPIQSPSVAQSTIYTDPSAPPHSTTSKYAAAPTIAPLSPANRGSGKYTLKSSNLSPSTSPPKSPPNRLENPQVRF